MALSYLINTQITIPLKLCQLKTAKPNKKLCKRKKKVEIETVKLHQTKSEQEKIIKKNQNQKISIKEQGVSMDEGKAEVEETA